MCVFVYAVTLMCCMMSHDEFMLHMSVSVLLSY